MLRNKQISIFLFIVMNYRRATGQEMSYVIGQVENGNM